MAIQILDGLGRGFLAQVDAEGHLVVDAIQLSELAHTTLAHQLSFAIAAATYDYDAADTILLIKNTDTDRLFHVEKVFVSSDTTTEVAIHVPTTEVATPTGTVVTPRNMNTGSGKTAAMTAIRDETSNSQGDLHWTGFILANTMNEMNFDGALVLETNKSLGVDLVTAGTGCTCTIWGFFE